MTANNIFDTDRIGRLLFKLALPAFMGMAVTTLYNVVDTIFIGHYVGYLGIGGLSIVFPIQMLSMGVAQMMGMGGASLISRLNGSKQIEKAEKVLGNAISAAVIFSAVIMVGGLVDIDFWLRIVGATPDILPYSRDYLQIILIGMFFQTFAMAMNFLIRAEGNAKVPMIGMMIGAVSNIALDAIFIILLDMGVQGAALATIIAQFFSVIYFAYYYLKGKSLLALHFRNLRLEWKIMSSIVAIGFASFAHMLANSFSVIIINRMLGNYGGDIAISVYGVLNRIAMFALMPGIVIGQGMQPILGYNYGAKRYARALKALKIAIAAATIWCGVAFVLLYFLPEPFIRIFASEAEIITMGAYAAKRIFLVIYVVGFIIVSSTAFQALGKVPQSIISSTARSVLFLIPALLIMPQYLGLDGVWLAFPLTDVLTFMVAVALLLPQVRILQKAIKEQTMQVPASEA